MRIEVPVGDIVDKLSILNIKLANITDKNKLANILREQEYLTEIVISLGVKEDDYTPLHDVNKKLWNIEDSIREMERKEMFDGNFIELARLVYKTNDVRAKIKRDINIKFRSEFIEEKSYTEY